MPEVHRRHSEPPSVKLNITLFLLDLNIYPTLHSHCLTFAVAPSI